VIDDKNRQSSTGYTRFMTIILFLAIAVFVNFAKHSLHEGSNLKVVMNNLFVNFGMLYFTGRRMCLGVGDSGSPYGGFTV